MSRFNPDALQLAVRVYPSPKIKYQKQLSQRTWELPKAMFVFDTECRVDASQRLTFGSYRFIVDGECREEGIFYGDDLPKKDFRTISRYVADIADHPADTVHGGKIHLLTRDDFVKKLYRAAYKGQCLVVAFNFPFDASRVAFNWVPARGRFAGGFALELWSYIDDEGRMRHNPQRPRLCIKHIDSKRALKGFTARRNPDREDLIPPDSESGEPEIGFKFRGHLLDLRTLAFALTDRGHTLDSACKAFGVEHGKQEVSKHGEVTPEYIDYNRRDVLATSELAFKLLEEYDKHPIKLQATKAYSPASIGKAYLQAMGIPPILERQPDFPTKYMGHAASAFFGGRTSAHIRKVAVPVVYTDFVSMYPTVNSLMGLWRFVIADKIRVIEHCKNEISEFLSNLNPDTLFTPETWKQLCGFVQIIPDGDILPSRAKYNDESNDWQVAVNYIHGTTGNSQHLVWYSLPDIVASVVLTGRVPNIIDAFRIEPIGSLRGLKPIKLRGTIPVDPSEEDFFRVVIEQRRGLASRKDLGETERKRLDKALKVLANATSYGIYAEMNREESDRPVNVTCHGIDAESFTCRVPHPDVPGKYCFPPLAALITGGARLMLALLEHSVTRRGGTYAMEDTDSMAIVATETGGTVPCAGGPDLKALSWKEVDEIVAQFGLLNPYKQNAPKSILDIEEDNFDPKTKAQRQLYCFAISAKRYVLFLRGKNGRPTLLREEINNHDDRWSQHGLGHLLNPTDLENEDREWIAQVWLDIICRADGSSRRRLQFRDMPAVGRVSVSSPPVIKPLSGLNVAKKYPDQIKPFNFLLTCHVRRAGHPTDADEDHFHLIAPYESDPQKWLALPWIDQYSDKRYGITTKGHHGTHNAARVKTYGEVVREYEFHAESKCADIDGNTCDKQTIGLLQRRHVPIDYIRYIGKESNSLEEVVEGLVHDEKNVYTEYPDPRRDEWASKILPALKKAKLSALEKLTGLSRTTLRNLRAGRTRPNNKTRTLIVSALRDMGLI